MASIKVDNFDWLIEGQLAGSGGSIHHEESIWLQEQGIGAIVSLTERSLRREKMLLHRLDPLGFTYRHIPVVDETAPTQARVRARRPGSIAPLAQQACVVEYAERLWHSVEREM
jgi:hypothetical protein